MERRALPLLMTVAFAVAGCGGGSGGSATPPIPTTTAAPPLSTTTPPGVVGGPFAAAGGPVTQVSSSGTSAIGTTLLPSSADGVFLIQSPSQPPPPDTGIPAPPATYTVTLSEAGGLATSSRTRSSLAVAQPRLGNDRETNWEVPQSAFARTTSYVTKLRGQSTGRRTESVRAARAAVGTSKVFHILTSSIGNSGGTCATPHAGYDCYTDITATLKYQSTHGNVWVDNMSLADPNEFTNPSDFQTVGTDFDTYYNQEVLIFGPAFLSTNIDYSPQCDANGTPLPAGQDVVPDLTGATGDSAGQRIDIVITDALQGTGEGGYFFGGNFIAQQVLNCQKPTKGISNEVPMFVMGGNNYQTGPNLPKYNENFWLNSDVPRTMSHEFQHLLHFVNKVLKPNLSNAPSVQDDPFIEEGASMLAEDLVANGIAIDTPRYSYTYLLEPNLYSLTSFTGYQPNPTSTSPTAPYGYYTNTAGSYGQAYLFMRYVYDRFGGNAAMARLYANGGAHTAPVVAAANGEPFPQLYLDFVTALAAQTAGTGVANDPRYQFGPEITLRGTVTLTSRRLPPPLDTRTLVFGGPQPPEVFANNLPTGAFVTLSPGQSTTATLIDGATLFLPLAAPGSSGATLRASGPVPALQGGVVQGALPTPPPASR